jgi:hypothetical protein
MEKRKRLALVMNQLKEDDRAFLTAERLLSELTLTEDDKIVGQRVEELTCTLAQVVSEELYCRLDRLYLEAMLSGEFVAVEKVAKEDEQRAGLEEELESLYPEIDVLAEMSTKRQFGERILQELARARSQSQLTLRRKLEYVRSRVSYSKYHRLTKSFKILHMILEMTRSIQSIREHLLDIQLYHEALEKFANTYKHELDELPSTQAFSRRDSVRGSIPTSLSPDRRQPPESQVIKRFLRRLGVSSEPSTKSSEQENYTVLHEKRRHMAEFLRNLGTTADSGLVAHLDPIHKATLLLGSALHADSCYDISLVDDSQMGELAALESKLGLIQKGMQGINLDILHQRDKNQERFIERWQ